MIVQQELCLFLCLASSQSVGKTGWAVFKQFQGDFEGVFVLYFWWGFVQSEDPCQIRWEPQMLSFPASALVENHFLAAFEGFWRISRRFWRGSSFCSFGGVLYKTKALAKFVKTANIIVPRFCFRLESCLIYFQASSRRYWRSLHFWVFGLRIVPSRLLAMSEPYQPSSAVIFSLFGLGSHLYPFGSPFAPSFNRDAVVER